MFAAMDDKLEGAVSKTLKDLAGQAGTSETRDSAGHTTEGPIWYTRFMRAGHTFGMDYLFRQIDPQFVAGSGFISRAGVGTLSLDHRVTLYNAPGSFIETYGGDFRISDTWGGRSLTGLQGAEDQRYQFNTTASLHCQCSRDPWLFSFDDARRDVVF